MASYSETHWWSRWEVFHQIVQQFVHSCRTELSATTRRKLLQILKQPVKISRLQVELAVVIDAGEPFVKATYLLEGDGPLALKCYEIVNNLFAGIHIQHFPNLAVARTISPGSASRRQQWIDYRKACVAPGLRYFNEKFSPSGELGSSLQSC